jgi:uncharacterized repeat protein (TIGR03803 family)
VSDRSGSFYGTAWGKGHGDVFKVTPNGAFKVLHSFNDKTGGGPMGDLVCDASGTIFGAATGLGFVSPGIVFQITPDGAETVLYDFGNEIFPNSGVIADDEGNLYGTTLFGDTVYELVK